MAIRPRVVLNFHGIGAPPPGVPDDERRYWCPRDEWPPLADALAAVDADGRVELRITFDDGNRSDIADALPALVDRGLVATFFPCAGRLATVGYLDADDLGQLRAAGMGVGSHGWAHVDLRRVDDAELERETRASRERLAEAGGGPVDEFAIPFGSYDRRVLRSLREYHRVFTSDRGHASGSWLTPRTSYVRGWAPRDLLRIATEPSSWAQRLRWRAKTLVKAVR